MHLLQLWFMVSLSYSSLWKEKIMLTCLELGSFARHISCKASSHLRIYSVVYAHHHFTYLERLPMLREEPDVFFDMESCLAA
jgi:hypothetical protein